MFCLIQYLDTNRIFTYCLRHYRIIRYVVNWEDVNMSQHTTRILSLQDYLICPTLLGFFSVPLLLLMGAAAIIAG